MIMGPHPTSPATVPAVQSPDPCREIYMEYNNKCVINPSPDQTICADLLQRFKSCTKTVI
jgi:hypothetical protein